MSIRTGLCAALLLLAAGCTSTPDTVTADIPTITTPPTEEQPTVAPSSTPTPPPPAAKADPFAEYAKTVGPLEPTLSAAQLREKYDGAVKLFCPGGRAKMVDLKNLGSNPPGVTGEKLVATNRKTATAIGALWEFGCGKGHDAELYKPLAAAKNMTQGAKYTCKPDAVAKFEDPAHPNVITNKSCDGLAEAKEKGAREFAECQQNPAKVWDTATQTCKSK